MKVSNNKQLSSKSAQNGAQAKTQAADKSQTKKRKRQADDWHQTQKSSQVNDTVHSRPFKKAIAVTKQQKPQNKRIKKRRVKHDEQPKDANQSAMQTITDHKVAPSSNWRALQVTLKAASAQAWQEREDKRASKRRKQPSDHKHPAKKPPGVTISQMLAELNLDKGDVERIVALDCEMVGVGPSGYRSALARVCIVNGQGETLLDQYAKPDQKVTDFRTDVSGVTPWHLKDAPPIPEVQATVKQLLEGKLLVGHGLSNDFKVLDLQHPPHMIRDTAKFPPLMRPALPGKSPNPRSLKELSALELGLLIQDASHTPVDDARSALYLYLKNRSSWEQYLKAAKATGPKRELELSAPGKRWAPKPLVNLYPSTKVPGVKRARKLVSVPVNYHHLKDDYLADL